MTDDSKNKETYKADPHKVPRGKNGNFEIFQDTTEADSYSAVSLLTGKVEAQGKTKADLDLLLEELNKKIAEEKGKVNENCPFCAKQEDCKDRGDPTKVDCFEPPANNVFDLM